MMSNAHFYSILLRILYSKDKPFEELLASDLGTEHSELTICTASAIYIMSLYNGFSSHQARQTCWVPTLLALLCYNLT